MGRLNIVVDDEIDKKFRASFSIFKKGKISEKIQELIENYLEEDKKSEEKQLKMIKKFFQDVDKFILKLYNSEEISVLGANKVSEEWNKIKGKYQLE